MVDARASPEERPDDREQRGPLGARALLRQLAGDLLLWNNVKTLVHFGRELRDPRSLLRLPPAKTYPEFYATVALWSATPPPANSR